MQIFNDYPLKDIVWYKIGGKTRYLLQCENREDIVEALEFIKIHKPGKIFVCGLGSNLIFADEYFDGVVIQIVSAIEKLDENIHVTKEGNIEVFAGVLLDTVILYAFEHNLTGLEWAGGLPGTVGAGVRGNVGAYGGEIKDTLVSVTVLDYSLEVPQVTVIENKDLQFVYRGSLIKTHKKMVVVSALFHLKKSDHEEITKAKEVYDQHRDSREKNHPLEYPNCGSVFKNLRDKKQIATVLQKYPDMKEDVTKKWYGKVAVASLIERLGLKGYTIGQAQVSEKHALFIINKGNATAKDVLQIISKIQNTFQEQFGFKPEVEVEIVN